MLWQKFVIQCRVFRALLIREVLALYGRETLGAGWLIAEPLVFVLPVMTLWYFVRAPFEHGIALMPLLLTGYLPLLVFRHIGGGMLFFIRNNAGLLYHRDVTLFDIFFARCAILIAQNIAASLVVFVVFYVVGAVKPPEDFALLLTGYFYMVWWSVNVGLAIGALCERATWVEKIWAPYSYTYLFYCGFWFLADWLPPHLREIALYQPSLQAYEMLRAGYLGGAVRTYYDFGYTAFVLGIGTCFGLAALSSGRKFVTVE